jgi:hypothetical protein
VASIVQPWTWSWLKITLTPHILFSQAGQFSSWVYLFSRWLLTQQEAARQGWVAVLPGVASPLGPLAVALPAPLCLPDHTELPSLLSRDAGCLQLLLRALWFRTSAFWPRSHNGEQLGVKCHRSVLPQSGPQWPQPSVRHPLFTEHSSARPSPQVSPDQHCSCL